MTEQEKNNRYLLARRAKDSNDWDTARRHYEAILLDDPNDWEAVFYTRIANAMDCSLAQFKVATEHIKAAVEQATNILGSDKSLDPNAQVKEIVDTTVNVCKVLHNAAKNHYLQYSSLSGTKSEYDVRLINLSGCLHICAMRIDGFHYHWSHETHEHCIYLLFDAIIYQCEYLDTIPQYQWTGLNTMQIDSSVELLQKYRPNYKHPIQSVKEKQAAQGTSSTSTSGGCYVATCVYGSYDCPEVWTLRRFRDDTLASTWYGRAFIRTYYAISPTLVKWFGKTAWFKKMWQGKLDKMVSDLRAKGVEDTPYNDKKW